jgi:hypothetical protein
MRNCTAGRLTPGVFGSRNNLKIRVIARDRRAAA